MNKKVLGIAILAVLICLMIGIKVFTEYNSDPNVSDLDNKALTDVTIAVGGGKEDFIADTRVNEIMREKYGINAIYDS